MGEKFPKATQDCEIEQMPWDKLVGAADLEKFVTRRAVQTLFVALGERIVASDSGNLTMMQSDDNVLGYIRSASTARLGRTLSYSHRCDLPPARSDQLEPKHQHQREHCG